MKKIIILLVFLVFLTSGCVLNEPITEQPSSDLVNVSCNQICESHNYQVIGATMGGYSNRVCYCKSNKGEIFTFTM